MPRLEELSEVQRKRLLNFPCFEHIAAPATPLHKPLAESKLALVTTAGLHLPGDTAFTQGDQSFRVIPSTTDPASIVQSHVSIAFDRTAFYRDVNISFPMDRARELVEQGVIGGLATNFYSFMGAQPSPTLIRDETGPEVACRLREDGVDVVLLTPT